jgi:CRP-like cAMP-binding protein
VLRWLEEADVDAAVEVVPAPPRDRHPDTTSVRLERGRIAAPTLRALPLFASLTDAQLRGVARSARLASAAPGEEIVRRWEAARDFYVLVEGTAEVRSDGEHIRDLGRGDFFGELAALDWGASFGYARLATVIATSPVQAVVLSSHALNALMRESPGVAAQVERAVRERLPRS